MIDAKKKNKKVITHIKRPSENWMVIDFLKRQKEVAEKEVNHL